MTLKNKELFVLIYFISFKHTKHRYIVQLYRNIIIQIFDKYVFSINNIKSPLFGSCIMIDPVQFLHVQNAVGYIKVILFY